MPEGVYVFEEGGRRGLEGAGHSLTIHQDGTLEYDSQTAEYNIHLPPAIADPLYAAFEGRAGQPLQEAIEVDGDAEEDPANVGGRKRRARGSRVKKQTRRTKGRRRNTVRK